MTEPECNALAEKLGCRIVIRQYHPDCPDCPTISVFGPRTIYPRRETNWRSTGEGWDYAWWVLENFQWDFHCATHYIDDEVFSALNRIAPEGQQLFKAWLDDEKAGLVLADWLDEHGHEPLARIVRRGVEVMTATEFTFDVFRGVKCKTWLDSLSSNQRLTLGRLMMDPNEKRRKPIVRDWITVNGGDRYDMNNIRCQIMKTT